MTRFGTNHFASQDHAVRYYQRTEMCSQEEAQLMVRQKWEANEIELCKPPERIGETLQINDDGRWEYVASKFLPQPSAINVQLSKADSIALVQYLNCELGDSRIKGTGELLETLNRVYCQLTGKDHESMVVRRKYSATHFKS